jgi:hypothetical protein
VRIGQAPGYKLKAIAGQDAEKLASATVALRATVDHPNGRAPNLGPVAALLIFNLSLRSGTRMSAAKWRPSISKSSTYSSREPLVVRLLETRYSSSMLQTKTFDRETRTGFLKDICAYFRDFLDTDFKRLPGISAYETDRAS